MMGVLFPPDLCCFLIARQMHRQSLGDEEQLFALTNILHCIDSSVTLLERMKQVQMVVNVSAVGA
jgi:hypothetical protein